MIIVAILGTLIVGLIALYLTRPRFQQIVLSAARFLEKTSTPPPPPPPIWYIKNLLLSRPFYLQLLFLLILIAAILSAEQLRQGRDQERVGVWIVLDTSASMSTRQDEEPRFETALNQVATALDHVDKLEDVTPCYRLSSFDLAWRDWVENGSRTDIATATEQFEPRPLGTNLNLLRTVIETEENELNPCPITHVLVVTDQVMPDWMEEVDSAEIIWQDIGQTVNNVGFTAIRSFRDPLTGMVNEVELEISSFGTSPRGGELIVRDQFEQPVEQRSLSWTRDTVHRATFFGLNAGTYQFELEEGGAYSYDDTITLQIPDARQILVDWQLSDRTWLEVLIRHGWHEENSTPHLRIISYPNMPNDDIPTLIVGDHYQQSSLTEINYFDEKNRVLQDLNLDVAEQAAIDGIPFSGLPNFDAVLTSINDNSIWVAQRREPLAVYVPGLPTTDDPDLDTFSTVLFFNAVQLLLQERDPAPLYTLTNSRQPEPNGNRLALHDAEGITTHSPSSIGEISDIQPSAPQNLQEPVWSLVIVGAAIVMVIERTLSAYGGVKWH